MTIELDFILYLAGAIITLAAAGGIIVKFAKKKITAVSESVTNAVADTLEKRFIKKLDNVNQTLKDMIEVNQKRDKATRLLSLKNAASRIFEAHSHYMKRQSITTFALANLEELFVEYTLQGGNSHAKICMEQLRKLPIVERPEEVFVKKQEDHAVDQ